MIIPKVNKFSKEKLKEIESIVGKFECNIQVIVSAHKNIYAIIGDERIVGLNYISRVDRMESVYKLMGIRSDMAGHKKKIDDVTLWKIFIS